MKPSSRTPEGEPNRCPLCGNVVWVEPSNPPGDAPCPYCGQLLWFRVNREGPPIPALSSSAAREVAEEVHDRVPSGQQGGFDFYDQVWWAIISAISSGIIAHVDDSLLHAAIWMSFSLIIG